MTNDDLNQLRLFVPTYLPADRETGRPRGFAFIEMDTEAQEATAIEALDGAEWMGRDLKVNK